MVIGYWFLDYYYYYYNNYKDYYNGFFFSWIDNLAEHLQSMIADLFKLICINIIEQFELLDLLDDLVSLKYTITNDNYVVS